MKATVNVFVYGTLKKDGYFFKRTALDREIKNVREAELPGFQLWMGMYPCIQHGDNLDSVKGEVHEYPVEVLNTLDAIEGHPHLYERTQKSVRYNDGTRQKVWVYQPKDPVLMRDATLIEDGNFKV